MTAPILVLNCGSSSIKFALFETNVKDAKDVNRRPFWHGNVDGINSAATTLTVDDAQPEPLTTAGNGDPFHHALTQIRQRVIERLAGRMLRAVAHRVVHGGLKYSAPVCVDHTVLTDLIGDIPLAPLHQPFALEAIKAFLSNGPIVPQVACFDTAFHQTMPETERRLPLPHELWDRGVRRFGFHGLSYEYMSVVLAERYGLVAQGKVIVAHLGSGASLCAMQGLQSVATTMGFSALDGLMMGTRCGAIDPGALLYLMQTDGLTPEQLSNLLYHHAGLLGVSGRSADPRELFKHEADDSHSAQALALYVHRLLREIGALTAVLGGLDMLVFTAGIGEHSAELRERLCALLGFVGVAIDVEGNQRNAPVISSAASRVRVVIEATNEEWIAARHAAMLITAK